MSGAPRKAARPALQHFEHRQKPVGDTEADLPPGEVRPEAQVQPSALAGEGAWGCTTSTTGGTGALLRTGSAPTMAAGAKPV